MAIVFLMRFVFFNSKLILLLGGFALGLLTHWALTKTYSDKHFNTQRALASTSEKYSPTTQSHHKNEKVITELKNQSQNSTQQSDTNNYIPKNIGLTRKMCSQLEMNMHDKMFKDFYDPAGSEQEKEDRRQKLFDSIVNMATDSLYWSSDALINVSDTEYNIQFHLIIFESSDIQNQNAIDLTKIHKDKLCWKLDTTISKNSQISTWDHINCISMGGAYKKNNVNIISANNYQTDFTSEVIGAITLAFPFENSQDLLWYEIKSESWKKGNFSNWKNINKEDYERQQTEINSKLDLQSSN
ncbi:hypothetical protein K2X05_11695 [bacterium]|nr:hypothetical protein [bacterium]